MMKTDVGWIYKHGSYWYLKVAAAVCVVVAKFLCPCFLTPTEKIRLVGGFVLYDANKKGRGND